ncbi:MAG: response regulator [Bacteriovoracaceae bacterium]
MFAKDINILVVDDMNTMRKIVKNSLRKLGFVNFNEAVNGVEAWKILNSGDIKFDLIVSDWNMPKMTGLELLKKVRGEEVFKSLPFLMVTAEGEQEQIKEAIGAGVSNFLLKPFTPDSFQKKLELVYKKHNQNAA